MVPVCSAHAWLTAWREWRRLRLQSVLGCTFDGTHPEEGSGNTHWAGSMLCHSNRIKQGFRLAQTIVYTIDCDTAYCLHPKRQGTSSYVSRQSQKEVKDEHATLHHNQRGPLFGGGGRPTRTAQRAEKRDRRKTPENGVIPSTQEPGS